MHSAAQAGRPPDAPTRGDASVRGTPLRGVMRPSGGRPYAGRLIAYNT
ncbi:MAG: hypothetical protein OJF49_003615 [Ktedonobacterales bacterium]|nr:MAG: hypothetical protein OJF49_003615 [Ktedonobacterales bacterium]